MRLHAHTALLVCIFILLSCGISVAEDFDIGEVIEVSPDHAFIQVKDRNYKISKVFSLAIEGTPGNATPEDIIEGALVKVVKGDKDSDFWIAESVTIYQGEMEKTIREEMELLEHGSADTTSGTNDAKEKDTPETQPSQGEIILKDGVFSN